MDRGRQRAITADDNTYERHHILPRSLGGSNDPQNLVKLTVREHYIAHRLLYHASRFASNKKVFWKQVYSLNAFHSQHHKRDVSVFPSRVVEQVRNLLREHKRTLVPYNKGKKASDQVKARMRASHYLKNGGVHPMLNKKHSAESRKKMSVNSSKWWCKAVSPEGEVTICKSTTVIATIANTNVDTFVKFCNTDQPVPMPGKRYVVQSTKERLNAIGWKFYRQTEPFDK